MVKFLIGLVILLAICVAAGVIRKLRGGNLLPPPENIDGKPEPQSLKELAERRRAEKQQR
jgi:hypothetical protein